MIVRMTIEVKIDNLMISEDDDEEKMWMENDVFIGDGSLLLHSNEIGDTVGYIKKVSNVQWFKSKKD